MLHKGIKNIHESKSEIRFWDRKTQELCYSNINGSLTEIWKYRYFLDWDSKMLNEQVSCQDLESNSNLWYFINYPVWTRTFQAISMSAKFFHKHADRLDLDYMFKNQRRFPNLTEQDFIKEHARMSVRKMNGHVVRSTTIGKYGEVVGIKTNVYDIYDFGRQQLKKIKAGKQAEKEAAAARKKKELEEQLRQQKELDALREELKATTSILDDDYDLKDEDDWMSMDEVEAACADAVKVDHDYVDCDYADI